MSSKILKVIFLILFFFDIPYSQGNNWISTGAPFSGGSFQGSTYDSLGNLYLATEYGGIFCSRDNGNFWQHVHFEDTYTFEMATDRKGNVFASINNKGIICTTDGGIHWEFKNQGLPVGKIPVVYTFPSENEILIGTYPPGLFRSLDNGNTWNQVSTLPVNIQYIGGLLVHSSGQIYLGSIDSGMFRSNDNGITWDKIQTFPNNVRIVDIKELPTGRLLAATRYNGVYKSSDGDNWSISLQNGTNFFNSVQYTNSGVVYACDAIEGIYRSTDYGDSWNYLGFYNVAIRSMVCLTNGDVYIFSGESGGYKLLAPNGTSWRGMNIPAQEVYSLIYNDNILFSGGNEGFLFSKDHGKTWLTSFDSGLPHTFIYDLKIGKSKTIYAALFGASVWKSINKGAQWSLAIPITDSTELPYAYSLAIDSSGTVYAGFGENGYYSSTGGKIYKTLDNDTSWIKIMNGAAEGTIAALFITRNNSVLASITGHGVFRSQNGGEIWKKSSNGLPPTHILGEAFAQDNAGLIYFGTSENGVYKSTDDGVNWKPANSGIESQRIFDIVLTENSVAFIGTLSGVYKSTNKGNSWEPFSEGITNPSVWSLAMDDFGYLYAGTIGTNVFRTNSPIKILIDEVDKRENVYLFSTYNYPNPFNPSTTIAFGIPSKSFVSLKVYDVIGREVTTIVSEELSPGNYKKQWNGQGISSGVYFYRIHAGNFVETKKLILLK